jgi:hypothetical protein
LPRPPSQSRRKRHTTHTRARAHTYTHTHAFVSTFRRGRVSCVFYSSVISALVECGGLRFGLLFESVHLTPTHHLLILIIWSRSANLMNPLSLSRSRYTFASRVARAFGPIVVVAVLFLSLRRPVCKCCQGEKSGRSRRACRRLEEAAATAPPRSQSGTAERNESRPVGRRAHARRPAAARHSSRRWQARGLLPPCKRVRCVCAPRLECAVTPVVPLSKHQRQASGNKWRQRRLLSADERANCRRQGSYRRGTWGRSGARRCKIVPKRAAGRPVALAYLFAALLVFRSLIPHQRSYSNATILILF